MYYFLFLRYDISKSLNFRGFVQCLKLSPNLRKKTKAIKSAAMGKDDRKILQLEMKKLESIMEMVREPDDSSKNKEDNEDTP